MTTAENPVPPKDVAQQVIDRVHPALLAFLSVLAVCAVLGGFAMFMLSSAQAQTTQQIEPIKVRQSFTEEQMKFMLTEQRESREETRAALKQVAELTGNRVVLKPLKPLPLEADGGSP